MKYLFSDRLQGIQLARYASIMPVYYVFTCRRDFEIEIAFSAHVNLSMNQSCGNRVREIEREREKEVGIERRRWRRAKH